MARPPKGLEGVNVSRGGAEPQAIEFTAGELHLVVFGPGSSEGIVLVLPNGDVGVIDGVAGDVIPTLLDQLGVDNLPDSAVPQPSIGRRRLLFACLTHPHKDHYPGFAQLVETRRPKHLWWAGDEELGFFRAWCNVLRLIEGDPSTAGAKPRGWKEIDNVRAAIEDSFTRLPATRHRVLADRKRLLSHAGVMFESVLPTTSEKWRALRRLVEANSVDKAHRDGEAVNDLSGALIVRWGDSQILLGGDCNTGSEEGHCGWAGHGEEVGTVQVVKVPHHGSHTSWHPASWAEWKPTIALLTPYQRAGVNQPPTREDIENMRKACSRLFISTPKTWQLKDEGFDDARPVPTSCSSAVRVSVNQAGSITGVMLYGEAREL